MNKAETLSSANDYASLSAGLNAASGQPLDQNQDTQVTFVVGGTFAGVSVKPYLKTRGGTWVPTLVVDEQSGTVIAAGAISVSDDTTKSWTARFPAGMFVDAKLELVGIGSGDVDAEIISGKITTGGVLMVAPTAAAATTFAAGISLTGATGANVISMPDNLADALSISEGSNAYITFTTTNSGELIIIKKTMKFGGTTGNNIVSMVDNLADALNIKEGSNSYLKFVTTDSGECVVLGKSLTVSAGLTASGSTANDFSGSTGAFKTSTGTNTLGGNTIFKTIATPVAATGAGGGVAGAAALGAGNFLVVSSDGSTKGVKLLTGVAGDVKWIINSSSTACNLFAASGGTINGGSADAGCAIPASKGVLAICTAADTWYVFDMTAHAGSAA